MSVGVEDEVVDTAAQAEETQTEETTATEVVDDGTAQATETETAAETETEAAEPEKPETPDWITDDLREVAASYNMDDAELTEFGSARAFQNACRALDRRLSGLKPAETKAPETPAEKPAEKAPETPADDGTGVNWDNYDEETAGVLKRVFNENKAVREELTQLKKDRDEERLSAELTTFHEFVDDLDADLFGGDKDLTAATDANRKQLWEAYRTIKEVAQRTAKQDGRPAKLPPMKALLHRASLLAFGDEILAREKKKLTAGLQAQSKRRRPVPGKTKVVASPAPTKRDAQNINEAAQEILNDPEIRAIFDRANEENGNAPQ